MQMTNPQQAQYDRGKTIFSPDGRLFQVEYAKEAVKKGATALGVVYEDGVVLAATRKNNSLGVRNPEKVFKNIVEEARNEAQKHLMTYDEDIPVFSLAKFVADRCQQFTQYGGVRPYGVSTITGGVRDGEPSVYQTDPSGTLNQWKAVAIGKGGEGAREYLEENWSEDLSEDEAVELAVEALHEGEDDIESENIELSTVDEDDKFKRLEPEDLEERGL